MSKKIEFATILIFLTILSSIFCLRVFCMPNIDRYKQYEGNIVEMCETGDEMSFVAVSEAGRQLMPSKGEKNSKQFTYYMSGKYLKQIYKSSDKICIVTWDGETIDYMLYNIK